MDHPRMPRRLEVLSTVVLTVCAIVVTGLVLKREFNTPSDPSTPRVQRDWKKLGEKGVTFGAESGSVQVLVFSDFECPFCRQFATTLDSLLLLYPTQLHVVFRHFPLQQKHPNAFKTAVAAECAGQQGLFKAFHDQAFKLQDSLGTLSSLELARRTGAIDTVRFTQCLGAGIATARVNEDAQAAASLNLRATPTIIINRWQQAGAPPLDSLRERIKAELGNQ
jgi:protein-disulfide isomerase